MRITSLILCLSIGVIGLTACGESEEAKTSTHTKGQGESATTQSEGMKKPEPYVSPLPKDAPVLKVAISSTYEPFEFKDEYGSLIGYDVDFIRMVGEAAGYRIKLHEMLFQNFIPSLEKGETDIAMSSGLSISPEREADFSTSKPYIKSKAGYWVVADSPIQKLSDLENKKVSVQKKTNFHAYLKNQTVKLKETKTSFLAFQSIFTKKADAAVDEESLMMYKSSQFKEHPIRFIPFDEREFPQRQRVFISAADNRQEIITKLNEGIEQVKSDGKYSALNKQWFGDNAAKIAVN